jgi:5'-nucleotidase
MTRILVTNDDGVQAEGLIELTKALEEIADEVIVVAPEREQSATGHALTLHQPLRMRELRDRVYSVDGTPTDCVNLGVLWLLAESPPDLVVSGINHGPNLGDDVTYSGTVSAAFEGVLLGIPSVAFSQDMSPGFSFERSAAFAGRFIQTLISEPTAADVLLNVNLPAGEVLGVEFTKLGTRVYKQVVAEKTDPRGRRYFWIAGTPVWEDEVGSDNNAVQAQLASVTPLHLDLTDYRRLESGSKLHTRLSEIT